MFNSDAKQDQFVANLSQFKTNGFYIDIGSCNSMYSNNSFYFDNTLNWKGICIEIEKSYSDSYSNRKNCCFINDNALKINYSELLKKCNMPSVIDYLSLDIDTLNLDVLNIFPFNEYLFKIITIEHDAYLYDDKYRQPQRKILQKLGYYLVCSNVYVEQEGYYGKEFPFEDWYIRDNYFDKKLITKIQSESEYPSKIIGKFNE